MDLLLVGVDIDDPLSPVSLALPQLAAYLHAQPDLARRLRSRIRAFTTRRSSAQIARSLARAEAGVVGFSVYVWSERLLRPVIREFRARLPKATLVVGGPQVKGREREWLTSMPELDAVVTGEGEGPLADIVRRRLARRGLEGIANVAVRTRGLVRIEPPRPPMPFATFAELPSANLAGFAKIREGNAVLETVRGCPFRCGFCDFGHQNRGLRRRTLEAVEQELSFLSAAGARGLVFVDPVFNADRARAVAILQVAHRLGFESISVQIAAELLDEPLVKELAFFGMVARVGLQSTDPEVCKLMHRHLDSERFAQGLRLLSRYRVPFKLQLICGLPGDSYQTFCRSMDDAIAYGPQAVEAFALQVLPGTDFWQSADALGLSFEREPPHFVLSTDRFPPEDLERARALSMAVFKLHWQPSFRARIVRLSCAGVRPSEAYQRISSFILESGLNSRDELFEVRRLFDAAELRRISRFLDAQRPPARSRRRKRPRE
jgi:radical SAM superfamily enzyme YgiQ (UPF0313 family)